jgi:hypothetical protein
MLETRPMHRFHVVKVSLHAARIASGTALIASDGNPQARPEAVEATAEGTAARLAASRRRSG